MSTSDLLVEKVFFGKQGDFEKGNEMACSLPRSCTKVLREGKNTSNAHIKNNEISLRKITVFLILNFKSSVI